MQKPYDLPKKDAGSVLIHELLDERFPRENLVSRQQPSHRVPQILAATITYVGEFHAAHEHMNYFNFKT
jgi:hypothetical protein